MKRLSIFPTCGRLVLFTAIIALAADNKYVTEIQQSRDEDDRFMRSPKSPLLLVGRFKLEEGEAKLGSDAASNLVLPGRAPRYLGTMIRRGKEFSLRVAAETSFAVNDKPASGLVTLHVSAPPEPSDRVSFGDFIFAVRQVGQDFYLFLLDKQSKFMQGFKGKTWFPIDPAYRVTAQLVPYQYPKMREIKDTTGSTRTFTAPGYLTFQIGGQSLRLEPLVTGKQLFVMFRDKTSGKETYGGGRFLEAPLPEKGQTILDFNKAYNPYCAVTPYASCPMPPLENRLPVRVAAGETYQAHN